MTYDIQMIRIKTLKKTEMDLIRELMKNLDFGFFLKLLIISSVKERVYENFLLDDLGGVKLKIF